MLGTPPCIGETFTSLMYFENKSFDSPQWAILGGEGGNSPESRRFCLVTQSNLPLSLIIGSNLKF